MRQASLQLMLYGLDLAHYIPEVRYPGLTLEAWHPAASQNYLFLDLVVGPDTQSGEVGIVLRREGHPEISLTYELKERVRRAEEYTGFDASDVIYLITPDRFANGNPEKDDVPGLKEQKVDRGDDYARHGGDIRGMIDHLDYNDGMGFTAIRTSPLLTNDMPRTS